MLLMPSVTSEWLTYREWLPTVTAKAELSLSGECVYPPHTSCFGTGIVESLSWLQSPWTGLCMLLTGPSPPCAVCSWQFTCTDLWDTCMHRFGELQPPLSNVPVWIHRIVLLPLPQGTGQLYVDEIIIADTNITGDEQMCCPPWACLSNAYLALSC